jgi:hypothetical protein
MSFWTDVKKEDIDMSDDGKEIHILYKFDDQGNYYISVKTEDIKKMLQEATK